MTEFVAGREYPRPRLIQVGHDFPLFESPLTFDKGKVIAGGDLKTPGSQQLELKGMGTPVFGHIMLSPIVDENPYGIAICPFSPEKGYQFPNPHASDERELDVRMGKIRHYIDSKSGKEVDPYTFFLRFYGRGFDLDKLVLFADFPNGKSYKSRCDTHGRDSDEYKFEHFRPVDLEVGDGRGRIFAASDADDRVSQLTQEFDDGVSLAVPADWKKIKQIRLRFELSGLQNPQVSKK